MPSRLSASNPSSSSPSSSPLPASPRLYQDALVSVLRFLDLDDLVAAIATNHEWRTGVLQLPPIQSTLLWDHDHGSLDAMRNSATPSADTAARARLAAGMLSSNSPLLRHIARLHVCAKRNLLVAAVSSSLAHLRALSFALSDVAVGAPLFSHDLVFPAGLTQLYLEFNSSYMTRLEAATFPLLRACTQLRSLELDIKDYDVALPLHLLSASELPSLRSLTMRIRCWFRTSLHRRHQQAFATYTQLDHFILQDHMDSVLVPAVITANSNLRWQSVTTAEHAAWILQPECLQQLPTLTALHTQWEGPDLAWLQALPLLKTLALGFLAADDVDRDPDVLAAGLQACPQITSLSLGAGCPFNSKHLAAIVDAMLQLTELRLTELRDLRSIDFLSAGKLSSTLRQLSIQGIPLVLSEEPHLRGLHALRSLEVCPAIAMDEQTSLAYVIPSAVFPRLEFVGFGR